MGAILAPSLVQDFAFGSPKDQNPDIQMTKAHISAITSHTSYSSLLFPVISTLSVIGGPDETLKHNCIWWSLATHITPTSTGGPATLTEGLGYRGNTETFSSYFQKCHCAPPLRHLEYAQNTLSPPQNRIPHLQLHKQVLIGNTQAHLQHY